MRHRLRYLFSSLLLLSFLASGVALSAPVQAAEIEVESEVFLRPQNFSHVIVKKEHAKESSRLNFAKQVSCYLIEHTSPSARIAHASIGNSLYLLNSCFLI